MLDANPACGRVVHAEQHSEGFDTVRRVTIKRLVVIVVGLCAGHSGADKNTGTTPVDVAHPDLRIGERIARSH